jgi:hypothetical protein
LHVIGMLLSEHSDGCFRGIELPRAQQHSDLLDQ